jgi:hypothetical protein
MDTLIFAIKDYVQIANIILARRPLNVAVVADEAAAAAVAEEPEVRVPVADVVVALDLAAVRLPGSRASPNSRRSSATVRRRSARNWPRWRRSLDPAGALTTTACCSSVRARLLVLLVDRPPTLIQDCTRSISLGQIQPSGCFEYWWFSDKATCRHEQRVLSDRQRKYSDGVMFGVRHNMWNAYSGGAWIILASVRRGVCLFN